MNPDSQLYPFRRHLKTCSFFGPGGRDVRLDKCNCPFHVDGLHEGQRVRQSLKRRSRQIAERRVTAIVKTLDAKPEGHIDGADSVATPTRGATQQRTISEAVARFRDFLTGIEVDR